MTTPATDTRARRVLRRFLLAAAAIIVLTTLPGLRRGDRGPTYRFMGGLSAGLTGFVTILLTGIVLIHRDLSDATDARGVLTPLLAAFLGAAAIGAAAWFIQPRQAPIRATQAAVEPLGLGASERAVWMRETSMKASFVVLILVLLALALLGAVTSWLLAAPAELTVGLIALALVLLAAAAMATAFRVRVSERGLAVTSVFGFPRFRVPCSQIRTVETVDVNPVGDFGGWGLRWRPERFGVVTRAGEAIQVRRHTGRSFVVTVEDASTGAALLQTLTTRRATERL